MSGADRDTLDHLVASGRVVAVEAGARLAVEPVRDGTVTLGAGTVLDAAARGEWDDLVAARGDALVVDGGPGAAIESEDALAVALARAALGAGHTLRFRARGGSMRPLVPDGAVLEVRPAGVGDLALGAVVLYHLGEVRLVAHRVVGRRDACLEVLGDRCPRRDRIDARACLGRVEAVVRLRADGREERVGVSRGVRRVAGLVRARLYGIRAARRGAWRLRRIVQRAWRPRP